MKKHIDIQKLYIDKNTEISEKIYNQTDILINIQLFTKLWPNLANFIARLLVNMKNI